MLLTTPDSYLLRPTQPSDGGESAQIIQHHTISAWLTSLAMTKLLILFSTLRRGTTSMISLACSRVGVAWTPVTLVVGNFDSPEKRGRGAGVHRFIIEVWSHY